MIVSRDQQQLSQRPSEQRVAMVIIELWHKCLADISWFMRCLNKHLTRRANAEDHCTGLIWKYHHDSQALLDEAAVLNCMSSIDLIPIRAAIAALTKELDFTFIQ